LNAPQGNPGAGVGDVDLHQTLAVLLAGGVGSRLNVLVRRRAKPAVPFAGIYRIIDFTLSNIMNAGIERVGILTQYLPFSLSQHIARGEAWGLAGRHREARILPPHTGTLQSDWYKGTADAVFRNLSYIRRFDPSLVLILSGDHIYSMDYAAMIEYHLDRGADATLAVQEFPLEECSAFGTVLMDDNMAIHGFDEKPAVPKSPWISLGIYVFGREILESLLEEVTGEGGGSDFAKHVFPEMLRRGQRLVAYPFQGYWQDVGTLQAYFESHMKLLSRETLLDVSGWGVRTNLEEERSSDRAPAHISPGAEVQGSLISRGCKIRGRVRSSVLSPGVVVDEGAEVTESIIFHDAMIRTGSTLHRVIADKEVLIHRDSHLGVELGEAKANRNFPDHLNSGLTVLGKGVIVGPNSKIGRNCCIGPGMNLPAAGIDELADGETFDEGMRR
jgi:glucose-1-phosphate adenylyltransferase